MDAHVHDYKSVPVQVRKPHAVGILLLWLVVFFPAAFVYLLIPRGQDTEFQMRCSDCGAQEPKAPPVPFDWVPGTARYRGKR